jgi:ribosomal protein S18 acetylase RimI-like enzyme
MRKSTAGVTLRPRTAADDRFILKLSERLFTRYSSDPVSTTGGMLDEPGAAVVVAEHNRTRAGFAIVGFFRSPKDVGPWQKPTIARLNAIAVRPEVQGLGIGRLLVARAEDIALSERAVSLMLLTAETNVRARAMFESAGFMSIVRLFDCYRGGQSGIAMMKPLRSY